MFPSKDLLVSEYNMNFLDAESLKPYVRLGNISETEYQAITSRPQANPIFN